VALNGFDDVAAALNAVDASPMARMRAYLDFAAAHPRVYEAMFSLPSGLAFAAADGHQRARRAPNARTRRTVHRTRRSLTPQRGPDPALNARPRMETRKSPRTEPSGPSRPPAPPSLQPSCSARKADHPPSRVRRAENPRLNGLLVPLSSAHATALQIASGHRDAFGETAIATSSYSGRR
jgi:hypothetical protein